MRSFWLALVVVTSCTHLKAKEQTVAEHRSDAVLHQQRSLDERAKYDATEVKRVPPRSPMMGARAGWSGRRRDLQPDERPPGKGRPGNAPGE
jgi:hypothetical protein